MSSLLTLSKVYGGSIPYTLGNTAPDRLFQGLPLEADGSLAVDYVNAVDRVVSGFPLTSSGRLAMAVAEASSYLNGLGFSSDGRLVQSSTPTEFSPELLYVNGEAGTFSDIRTYATNYFSDAGTTPAEIGDPIYQINDQSGNGANWTQATATARPELSARYNLLEGTEITGNSLIGWNSNSGETAITTGISDPDGGTGAIKIEPVSGLRRAALFKTGGSAGMQFRHRIMYRSSSPGSFRIYLYTDQTTIVLSATTEWQEFQINSTLSGTNYGFQVNFGGTSTATEVEIYAPDVRLTRGTDQPPYQRVGDLSTDPSDYDTEGFDKYLKFDLGDDVLNCSLAAGIYTVVLPTREGIWIDEVVHAGGTFSIGPTSYTGGPAGILTALATGGECRMIGPPMTVNRSLTAAEQAAIVQWFRNRGAGPELELGPELVVNGTFDADISGWSIITGTGMVISWDSAGGGRMKLDSTLSEIALAGPSFEATDSVLGKILIQRVSVSADSAHQVAVGRRAGGSTPYAQVAPGSDFHIAYIATGPSTPFIAVGIFNQVAVSYVDNISLRKLQPKGA